MADGESTRQPGQMGEMGVWRIVDASANRAGEALRVVEDVVRFVLGDALLTRQAKDLRHRLASVLAHESLRCRRAARDVGGDVGVGVEAAESPGRSDAADLLAANAARAAQALRSLAECAAVVAPETVAGFESIRYGLYALERPALAAARARVRLDGVGLCVLVAGGRDRAAFDRLVATLFDAGVGMVQIRDKALDTPALVERVARALELAGRRAAGDRPLVVVNDRADVAAALGADGVHVGADDLPAALARRIVGPRALVGRTAHDLEEARAAVRDGADYLGIGPCFPSGTKSFAAFAPPAFLRAVAGEVALPAFAIGGITLDNLADLAQLGITRIAVASAVTATPDPGAAAAAFIERLRRLRAALP